MENNLPKFPNCYVCGQENERGLRTRWKIEDGFVSSELETECWMAGYEDVVHGGITSSMLDEAVIWAAYEATGQFCVTAELQVRFLKPVRIHQIYRIEGRLIHQTGRMHTVEAILMDASQQIMAKATAKVMPVKR